ncbi:hypothetical protein [Rhodothermus bifroesti]|uniref:hypothetical protein n=1 Tax=Rhodothermus bifroesti TaxID=2823335 RepID=UPI000CB68B67|nr:hypothetical protein [Rhodothermus bifroesti]GBD01274.1 hypothetical protein HRbin18_00995 [bacterium HR18]
MWIPERYRSTRGCLLLYVALGIALWPVPLLGMLHVEAAALWATVAFFVAGWWTIGYVRFGGNLDEALKVQLGLLLIPWLLLSVTTVWRPNCDYLRGLLFFILFPPVSVALAVALAGALEAIRLRRSRLWFVGVGLGLMVIPVFYDLRWHPQLYTYNHVFGGILGPIYEEALALRPGLFVFRAVSLLWALWLYGVWRFYQAIWTERFVWYRAQVGLALLLAACYQMAEPLGFNTSTAQLARALPGQASWGQVILHYDPRFLKPGMAAHYAQKAAYFYERLLQQFDITDPELVHLWVFSDPEQRAQLTGARQASVALVWLPQPQVHLWQGAFARTIAHELVHVAARRWGVLGISPRIGLLEGLAVALEPPDGRPTPHEQAAVAAAMVRDPESRLADRVATLVTPQGFWTSRSAVAYTLAGSFVRFLWDHYGADPLQQVYRGASFQKAYGQPLEALLRQWQQMLQLLPAVDRGTWAYVRRRFAVPALIERHCPHYVPPEVRAYEAAQRALLYGDTLQALQHLERVGERYPLALALWARIRLLRGEALAVLERLGDLSALSNWLVLARYRADAWALSGSVDAARRAYAQLYARWPLYDWEGRLGLVLRQQIADQPEALRKWFQQENEGCWCEAEVLDVSLAPSLPDGQLLLLQSYLEMQTMIRACRQGRWDEAQRRGEQLYALLQQAGAYAQAARVAENLAWYTWLQRALAGRPAYCCF